MKGKKNTVFIKRVNELARCPLVVNETTDTNVVIFVTQTLFRHICCVTCVS